MHQLQTHRRFETLLNLGTLIKSLALTVHEVPLKVCGVRRRIRIDSSDDAAGRGLSRAGPGGDYCDAATTIERDLARFSDNAIVIKLEYSSRPRQNRLGGSRTATGIGGSIDSKASNCNGRVGRPVRGAYQNNSSIRAQRHTGGRVGIIAAQIERYRLAAREHCTVPSVVAWKVVSSDKSAFNRINAKYRAC